MTNALKTKNMYPIYGVLFLNFTNHDMKHNWQYINK